MLREACLDLEDFHSPFEALAAEHKSAVTVIGCKETATRTMALVIEIEGFAPDALLRHLSTLEAVRHVYRQGRKGGQRVLAMVELRAPAYCSIPRDTGAVCASCPISTGGNSGTHWRLFVSDSRSSQRLPQLLIQCSMQATIDQVSDPSHTELLTPRQREVVLRALKAGYFGFPRRTSLTTLAERLSIRPSSLSKILRNAMNKMVTNVVEEGSRSVIHDRTAARSAPSAVANRDHKPGSDGT